MFLTEPRRTMPEPNVGFALVQSLSRTSSRMLPGSFERKTFISEAVARSGPSFPKRTSKARSSTRFYFNRS